MSRTLITFIGYDNAGDEPVIRQDGPDRYTIDDLDPSLSDDRIRLHPNAPKWIRTWQADFEIGAEAFDGDPITPGLDEVAIDLGIRVFHLAVRLIEDGCQLPGALPDYHLPISGPAGRATAFAATVMYRTFGIDLYAAHDRLTTDRSAERARLRADAAAYRRRMIELHRISPSLAEAVHEITGAYAQDITSGPKPVIAYRIRKSAAAILLLLAEEGRMLMPGKAHEVWLKLATQRDAA